MEYARKMVLIPEDRIESNEKTTFNTPENPTLPQKTVQTLGTTLTRLDNEMREILESSSYVDEREKWNAYHRILQRYLRLIHTHHPVIDTDLYDDTNKEPTYAKDEMISPIQPQFSSSRVHQTSHNLDTDSIIESVPKKYREKAALLTRKLKKISKDIISWDGAGVVSINGKVIHGSNIVDLVNEAMRSRKKKIAIGRKQFGKVLKDLNVPREYIGNENFLHSTINMEASTPERQHSSYMSAYKIDQEDENSSFDIATGNQSRSDTRGVHWKKLLK